MAEMARPAVLLHAAHDLRRGEAHLVHQNNLERLGLLRLPYGDFALREERIAETEREDIKGILSYLWGGWCVRRRTSRRRRRLHIQPGHEHDRGELDEQLRRIRIHDGSVRVAAAAEWGISRSIHGAPPDSR